MSENKDMKKLILEERAFSKLTEYIPATGSTATNTLLRGGDIARMNQMAFEIALIKRYEQIASHFIRNDLVLLTWKMVDHMLKFGQERIFRLCIKFQNKFDSASAKFNNIRFAGSVGKEIEDRTIKLVDFFQIMLDKKWTTAQIKKIL